VRDTLRLPSGVSHHTLSPPLPHVAEAPRNPIQPLVLRPSETRGSFGREGAQNYARDTHHAEDDNKDS